MHKSMAEISELIYETCKAYLIQQGKFLLMLEVFIGTVIVAYFWLIGFAAYADRHRPALQPDRHRRQLRRGLVRHPHQHPGQLPHRLRQPARARLPGLRHPAAGGHERRHDADLASSCSSCSPSCSSFPANTPASCFLGFAIGESLGASALRIAGGIFTKIADIGSDLMKIVFKIKEDDARNPGVIADCTGDNAGDSVGPTADGFETYGVTGVALISFIMLAVTRSGGAGPAAGLDLHDARDDGAGLGRLLPGQRGDRDGHATRGATKMNFEAPLTSLVWLTSIVSVVLTYVLSVPADSRRSAATRRCGGSSRRSSPAARSPAPSSPSSSRSSRRPTRPRARGGDLVARRRRVAQHPVRPRRRQLQRLLAGPGHHGPDGGRLLRVARSGLGAR